MIPEYVTEHREIMERLIDEFSEAILKVAPDPDHIPINPLVGALASILASYLGQIPIGPRFDYLQKTIKFCAAHWRHIEEEAAEVRETKS